MRMFERTYFKMDKKKSVLVKMRPDIQVNREEFREVANWVVGAEVDRHVIEVCTGSAIVIIFVMVKVFLCCCYCYCYCYSY